MPGRDFSEAERRALAARGEALPDGSYPMPDCNAVHRAIQSYGRAPASHRAELRALIRRRNSDLKCGHKFDKLGEP